MNISSKEIQSFIMKHWHTKHYCPYVCSNFSRLGWEMDVIAITRTLLVNEFEIKVSRSDYFADFQKVAKHNAYQNPGQQSELFAPRIPNRFYYCVPTGLVKPEEVPPYAGLIYFSSFKLRNDQNTYVEHKVIRKAPFLHRIKCEQALIAKVAETLTSRLVLGCALLTWKNKEIRERNRGIIEAFNRSAQEGTHARS